MFVVAVEKRENSGKNRTGGISIYLNILFFFVMKQGRFGGAAEAFGSALPPVPMPRTRPMTPSPLSISKKKIIYTYKTKRKPHKKSVKSHVK